MKYLNAEQIANRADNYNGRANRAAINRLYRRQDESHLYPINNRFDATERAIRRLQRWERQGGYIGEGLEYSLALDAQISQIVNSQA